MRKSLSLSFILFFGTTQSALAYFDPGTGSVIMQLILGGIGGVIVISKIYWLKIRSIFRLKPQKKKPVTKDHE